MNDQKQADAAKVLADVFGEQEELCSELAAHLDPNGPLGVAMIRHPLVYSMMHTPEMNGLVNRQYRAKHDALVEAERREQWDRYVWLHERPYRLDALMDLQCYLDDATYWELAGAVWVDSENIWQNRAQWDDVLDDDRSAREHMMDEDDREAYERMPDEITVYRGYNQDGCDDGLSWSVDRKVAEWFARRLGQGEARVVSGTVAKADVLAFLNGRGELEVVAFPDTVRDQEINVVGTESAAS